MAVRRLYETAFDSTASPADLDSDPADILETSRRLFSPDPTAPQMRPSPASSRSSSDSDRSGRRTAVRSPGLPLKKLFSPWTCGKGDKGSETPVEDALPEPPPPPKEEKGKTFSPSVEFKKLDVADENQNTTTTAETHLPFDASSANSTRASSSDDVPQSHSNVPGNDHNDPRSDSNIPESDHSAPRSDCSIPRSYNNVPLTEHNIQRSHSSFPRSYSNVPQTEHNIPRSYTNVPQSEHNIPRCEQNVPPCNYNVSQSDHNVPQSDLNIPRNNISIPGNFSNIPENDHNFLQNDHSVPQSDCNIPQSDCNVPQTNSSIPRSYNDVPQNDHNVSQSDHNVPQSNQYVSQSDHTVPKCDSNVPESDDNFPRNARPARPLLPLFQMPSTATSHSSQNGQPEINNGDPFRVLENGDCSSTTTPFALPTARASKDKMERNFSFDNASAEAGVNRNNLWLDFSRAPKRPRRTLCLDLNNGLTDGELEPTAQLMKQGWYHGSISRADAENLLRLMKKGSFLVRCSEKLKRQYLLSLKSSRGVMHVKIVQLPNGKYVIKQQSQTFDSIPQLIQYFSTHILNIHEMNVYLSHPVIEKLL